MNTVFVVNQRQLEKTYGASADLALQAINDARSDYRAAGFPSAILKVDTSAAAAYAAWNACPTSALKANAVVSAIGTALKTFRQSHPQLENVVLVGGDAIVPFARLSDLTTVANESGYANATFMQSEMYAGARAWKMLSDNPYGDIDPIPYFGRQLHVPDLAVGRLVETPAQIQSQVEAFTAAGAGSSSAGRLDPQDALTTGYDFLSDGGTEVRSLLGGYVGSSHNDSVINGDWTRSTLVGAGAKWIDTSVAGGSVPGITSLNGHADFYALQPPKNTSSLVRTEDVLANAVTFGGRVVFSMGCHAGLNVPDAFLPPNLRDGAPGHVADWAEAFSAKNAAVFIGNTGYGFGDTDRIAYGEELNRLFAQNMVAGTMTLGQALASAKQQYVSDLGLVGAYDEKTIEELTLFGLPMWRLGGTASPATASAPASYSTLSLPANTTPTVVTDFHTGLQAEPFDVTPSFEPKSGAGGGSYYMGGSGSDPDAERIQVTHFRPIQPKEVRGITIPNAHGALITDLTTGLLAAGDATFRPEYARPVVDSSAIEPDWAYNDVAFPSRIQSITTTKAPGQVAPQQKLVLVTGLFAGKKDVDAGGTGVETVVSAAKGLVYSSASGNYVPAEFTRIAGTQVSGRASFAIDLRERGGGAVKRVVVAYKESGVTAWHFLDLAPTNAGGTRWSGSGALDVTKCPAASTTPCFQFFAQAVNANGNVAVSTNKGLFYEELVLAPLDGLEIQAEPQGGAIVVDGWFKGAAATVLVKLDGQPAVTSDGIRVSIDGGGYQLYTGPFDVSGDGLHLVVAKATDGREASLAVPIDGTPPTFTATATTADGSTYVPGTWTNQNVTVAFSCSDGAGSGVVGAPTSQKIVTTPAGTELSISVSPDISCTDVVGYTATSAPFGPVQIDRKAPTVSLSSSAPTSTHVSPIPVTVTFSEAVTGFGTSDLSVVNGSVVNLAGSGASYTFDLVPAGQGTVSASVVTNAASDRAGNPNAASSPLSFTFDAVAPLVTLAPVASASADTTPTLAGTCGALTGDTPSVTIRIFAGAAASGTALESLTPACASGTFTVDAGVLVDGQYTAVANQSDVAGNVGTSTPRTFVIDTNGPVVSLTNPAPLTNDPTPTFTGACGAADGPVTINVFSGSTATGTAVRTISAPCSANAFSAEPSVALASGTFTAVASQTDAAGNTGVSTTRTFVIDLAGPTVALSAPPATTSDSTPTYTGTCGTAANDLAPVTIRVYLGSSVPSGVGATQTVPATCTTGAFSVDPTTALADGTYTAVASQTDAAGNTGGSAPRTFAVATFSVAGKVVFSRNGDIYALQIGSGAQPTRLTSTGDIDTQPAASPDGRYVLFSRGGNLTILSGGIVTDVKNGTRAVVGTAPTWAPSGTSAAWRIAYEASGKGVDVFTATVNPSTGALTAGPLNITNVAGDDRTPAWSPALSGSLVDKVLFSANRSKGSFKLYMRGATDTTGSTEVRVTIGSNDDIEPSWSPDASKIAFSSNFAGGTGGFEIHLAHSRSRLKQDADHDNGRSRWTADLARRIVDPVRQPAGEWGERPRSLHDERRRRSARLQGCQHPGRRYESRLSRAPREAGPAAAR